MVSSGKKISRVLMVTLIALSCSLVLRCPNSSAQAPMYDDWGQAGYPGDIPYLTGNIINTKDVDVVGDGITDDAPAIQSAIDDAVTPAVLFFPAGTYRIRSRLELKSGIVLRGEGHELTHLECLSDNGCISIYGYRGSFVSVQGGLAKGSNQIVVANAGSFTVGQGAQIQQEDIVPASASWGEDAVGQMVKIVAINGNTLTIDPPLHIEYSLSHNPQIRPVQYVEQVGIEDLHLKRLNSSGNESNISISRAADSWIRRVESEWTERYHVAVSESLHLEIRDSYIHDAESKGDGGEGYGVSLARHVTSVLVENNIFNELRHAMIIQIGTNGCVFGYNYAQRNYSDDGWDKSYISLHGHYPFLNLFEGNIVGWAYMGDYWGDIGPDNTLFRNRVIGTNRNISPDFGPYRGIALRYYHGAQYVVGNEVTGNDGVYFVGGTTHGVPADVVIHGNNVLGNITWDPAYSPTLETSYYLLAKPDFYGAMNWPSIGGNINQGTNPALERWQQGNYIPLPNGIKLRGRSADQTIRLNWIVDRTLPPTTTWQIDYVGPTGDQPSPITSIISPTRAYSLTGLANYEWYTVTLHAMVDSSSLMSDTMRAMPTDKFVYLPVVLKTQ